MRRVRDVGPASRSGAVRRCLACLAGVEPGAAGAWLVRPGGRVLFGEGCWERPPTAAAAMFGQDVIALADVVRLARGTGLQVLHQCTADLREWDDFEASCAAAASAHEPLIACRDGAVSCIAGAGGIALLAGIAVVMA